MKKGKTLSGYLIVTAPTNADGGKCVWARAEKDERPYFVKRFLEPKYPREGAALPERDRQAMLGLCRDFEGRHRAIMDRLKPDSGGGGNLVLAVDFFREGSTYYKVTEWIDVESLEKPQALEPRHKAVLLKTLGASLRAIHRIGVVHGDLKPANVLVQKPLGSPLHTAKLIDFDDSYLAGNPPDRTEITGDSLFGAPEWLRYVQGDKDVKPANLTTAVDVFALGLLTHFYLTGSLPYFGADFDSPADAVNAGRSLNPDGRLTPGMRDLVLAMTARVPSARPSVPDFLGAIDPEACALRQPPAPGADDAGSRPADPAAPTTRTSRLRTNITGGPRARTASASAPDPAPPVGGAPVDAPSTPPVSGKASRVRINLGDRRK